MVRAPASSSHLKTYSGPTPPPGGSDHPIPLDVGVGVQTHPSFAGSKNSKKKSISAFVPDLSKLHILCFGILPIGNFKKVIN